MSRFIIDRFADATIQILGTEWSRDLSGWYAHHFAWPGHTEHIEPEPCEATAAPEAIEDE